MKAVIYARTAIAEHTEHHNGIQAQVDACYRYAKENGFKVAGVFADAGFSGTKLGRPELSRTHKLIARGSIRAVVVSDFARLARSATIISQLEREFVKKGSKFHSVAHPFDHSIVRLIHAYAHKRMKRASK